MSKRFWPNGDAIGARFKVGVVSPEDPWFTVIGVIPDVNVFGIDPENPQAPATGFMPYAFQQSLNTGITLRVSGDPAAITSAVREQLRASDPSLPMFQARTVEESRQLNYWAFGLYGWIFGTIGVMGLLLASIGVYGVLSYSVEQRSQEIGVRVALGAVRWDVLRLVIGHGVLLAGIGILVGLVLSGLTMTFGGAGQFFYKVSPLDPVTFGAVSVFLVGVAFFASYLPARRAARVDPIVVLRGE
jgi:putative ABC transport system permease protein